MKIKIPHKNYSIVELYDTVASIMGRETENLQYDCRHINVAENIQQGFFDYYRETNPHLSEYDLKSGVCTLLLMSGPKTDSQLEDDTVEIFDGFIC